MAEVYGEGNFQYNFVEDWHTLPDGVKLLECVLGALAAADTALVDWVPMHT